RQYVSEIKNSRRSFLHIRSHPENFIDGGEPTGHFLRATEAQAQHPLLVLQINKLEVCNNFKDVLPLVLGGLRAAQCSSAISLSDLAFITQRIEKTRQSQGTPL
ncbi:MAG: hypothetical protein ACPGAF_00175, partial [Pseudohongiellaceae bacterium]